MVLLNIHNCLFTAKYGLLFNIKEMKIMTSKKNIFKITLISLLLFNTVFALEDISVDPKLSKSSYMPGDSVTLALIVTIPQKYHLYGNPLGPGIGKPLSVAVTADGIRWEKISKLPPKKFIPETGGWVWAYENRTVFFLRGILDSSVGEQISGSATIDALICHTACIPVHKVIPFTVNIDRKKSETVVFDGNRELVKLYSQADQSMDFATPAALLTLDNNGGLGALAGLSLGNNVTQNATAPINWNYIPQEKRVSFNLLLAICFGFIAGIILNFMPCVLPVIGIKILSFSETNTGSRKSALIRSGVFAAGILSVFTILAALASFASFSWGEQFQNPIMLIGIITIIVVFALWMFEIINFTIPGSLTSLNKKGEGLGADFLRGVFATILATPCSGPFLGATLAWALTQSTVVVFIVFFSIGAGMAFPYILLSSSKRIAKMIPKPGKWMVDFKNLMGFILIGFAVYLLVGLPQDMIVSAIGICIVVIFSFALYFRLAPWGVSTFLRRLISAIAAIAVAVSGSYFSYSILYRQMSSQVANDNADENRWVSFDPALLVRANADKQNVIIDFTANWCMNCQYNKITVYKTKEIISLIDKKDILALKADLTKPDSLISSLMQNLGSRSVPFFAIFPADDPAHPIVMRDIVKKSEVIKALKALPDKK